MLNSLCYCSSHPSLCEGHLILWFAFFFHSSLHLHVYLDVDWAGDPTNHRFIMGYCFLLGDSLISWRSKKQSVVARSSTDAMYRALADTSSSSIGSYRIWIPLRHPVLLCSVTVGVLFRLGIMMYFMNALNILRSIVILCVITSCREPLY
jgi:uncharacterized protein (DUF2062 family)